jgi:hypothetical protein
MNELTAKDVKTKSGILTPTSIWGEREQWLQLQKDSQAEWEHMNDEQREAILEIVGHTMERLADILEQWVPYSLVVEEGKYLDVQFRIMFATLDEHVEAKKELTSRRVREAAEGTAALLADLQSGDGEKELK